MTDWVQAKVKKKRERDEIAGDRVGRNDRLSQGGSGKTKKPGREKCKREQRSQRPSGPE